MFGFYWPSQSGNMTYLIVHVISQDHVIEGSCGVIVGRPSEKIISLPSLVVFRCYYVVIPYALWQQRYDVLDLLPDLVRPRDSRKMQFYRQEHIQINYHSVKFGGHRHCGCGVITILVCHVILQDQVIKESWDVLVRDPLR